MLSGFVKAQDVSPEGQDRIVFIENKGQWHPNVQYKMELVNGALFFEKTGVTYHMIEPEASEKKFGRTEHEHGHSGHGEAPLHFAFRAEWVQSNAQPEQRPENARRDYRNYILGNNPKKLGR